MGSHYRRIADTGVVSFVTAAICVNSDSPDTIAFVASWMVAVEVENNFGVSFLTIDGCLKVT